MFGGEATAGRQLSPPVFLGGYNWHVATRFVPATTAAPGTFAGAVAPIYAAAAAAAAAAASVGGPAPSAGRLQLQLGVVCTAPGVERREEGYGAPYLRDIQRKRNLEPLRPQSSTLMGVTDNGGAPNEGMCDGTAAGKLPLSIASCTVGVVDAAGRPAWQVVQAPCMLQPGRSSSGVGSGAAGGVLACGPGHWEFWSGLSGLEASWWESGSALTTGGVLRLYCSLNLQA
jgi:hypothetical protein